MPSTKDFTNINVSNQNAIQIDDERLFAHQLSTSYNIISEHPMIDDDIPDTFFEGLEHPESHEPEDNYLNNRPFLECLLPDEYYSLLSRVDGDDTLLTILQTSDMYTNHWDSWCQIQACLFAWGGEECGRFSHELTLSENLADYVGSNYRDFVRYLSYVRRHEEYLRWGL